MRFKGLDLNLLPILDALLERRSTTRVAEDLHLSQPAISAALNRLREYFSDPLLAVQGRKMIPTVFAQQLWPQVKLLLGNAELLVGTTAQFDPATSNRKFRIGASDFLALVVFNPLLARLTQIAPGLSFEITPPTDDVGEFLNRGELDLLLAPYEYLKQDNPVMPLFEESYVIAGWSGNPMMSRQPSTQEVLSAGHISVELGRINRSSFAESQLLAMGLERPIEVLVSSFGLVPHLLLNTNRIAIMHRRLASCVAAYLPISYYPLPFEFPTLVEGVQFHRTRAQDTGLNWLIDEIRRVVA